LFKGNVVGNLISQAISSLANVPRLTIKQHSQIKLMVIHQALYTQECLATARVPIHRALTPREFFLTVRMWKRVKKFWKRR
jgi:hypothetical protein